MLVLHPDGGTDRLSGGERTWIPKAVTLDGPEGFVRVIMVADDDRIDVTSAAMRWRCWSMPRIRPAANWIDGDPVVLDMLLLEDAVEPTRPVRGSLNP